MSWFWDLIVDLFHTLITTYRVRTLDYLALFLLFLFRKEIGRMVDNLADGMKKHAFMFVTTLISLILILTLDDPLFNLSWYHQLLIALFLLVVAYMSYIRKIGGYVYEKKIRTP